MDEQKIKIVRVEDPDVALVLLPWFVEEGVNGTRPQLGAALYEQMINHPSDTFVVLLFDVQTKEIKGFGVAYCFEGKVSVWQVGSLGLKRNTVDTAFEVIKEWARRKGCKKITAETNRSSRIWQRRWGFKPVDDKNVEMEI